MFISMFRMPPPAPPSVAPAAMFTMARCSTTSIGRRRITVAPFRTTASAPAFARTAAVVAITFAIALPNTIAYKHAFVFAFAPAFAFAFSFVFPV